MKKVPLRVFLCFVSCLVIICGADDSKKKSQTAKDSTQNIQQEKYSDWQVVESEKFIYKCPPDWHIENRKNYNGKVELKGCGRIYSGELSFDDGISMSFCYVPDEIASMPANKKQTYSEKIINRVKKENNAQEYRNNCFEGYISLKNEKHTLNLVARCKAGDGGYFEVKAYVMGETKTVKEFNELVDNVMSTFIIK